MAGWKRTLRVQDAQLHLHHHGMRPVDGVDAVAGLCDHPLRGQVLAAVGGIGGGQLETLPFQVGGQVGGAETLALPVGQE